MACHKCFQIFDEWTRTEMPQLACNLGLAIPTSFRVVSGRFTVLCRGLSPYRSSCPLFLLDSVGGFISQSVSRFALPRENHSQWVILRCTLFRIWSISSSMIRVQKIYRLALTCQLIATLWVQRSFGDTLKRLFRQTSPGVICGILLCIAQSARFYDKGILALGSVTLVDTRTTQGTYLTWSHESSTYRARHWHQ